MTNAREQPEILLRSLLNEALYSCFKSFLKKAFHELYGMPMDWNWHHDVICDDLMASYEGEERRIIINVPPRSLKSFICSVAYPAWLMGRNPRMKIIGVSYAQELATKFSREQRTLMQSAWYRQAFTKTSINPKKSGEAEFETTVGGFRLATSTGGILTGRGADLIIIDDPMKPQDALSDTLRSNANNWIDSTLMTRLDDKQKGQMVMIMQRLHEQDSTGHLLEKGGWLHRSFPAIAQDDEEWQLRNGKTITRAAGELLHKERETYAVLDDLRRDLGQMHFSAQYLQMPIPLAGNIVRREWFRRWDQGVLPDSGQIVISVDAAMKEGANNDWTAITVWKKQKEKFYLIHLLREKMDYPRLRAALLAVRARFNARHILIEDTGTGTALIQQLKHERIACIGIKPNGGKVERMHSASIAFEQGMVFFPKEEPWLDSLERELLGFPATKHDDQVDSISQFLNWALTNGRSNGGRFAL